MLHQLMRVVDLFSCGVFSLSVLLSYMTCVIIVEIKIFFFIIIIIIIIITLVWTFNVK